MRTRALYLALAAALAALFAGILSGPATAGQTKRSAEPKAAAFTHPGVLVSRAQLDFVRAKVQAGAQPWKGAYDQMMASRYASLSRTAKPRAVVECGSYSNPNNGCTDEREDAIAAYTARARLVHHPRQPVRQEGDPDHGRLVGHDQGPHQQQRPAADRLGRLVLAAGRRDHQATPTRQLAATPGRFATMLRNVYLPEGHQRLEHQRQLGADA